MPMLTGSLLAQPRTFLTGIGGLQKPQCASFNQSRAPASRRYLSVCNVAAPSEPATQTKSPSQGVDHFTAADWDEFTAQYTSQYEEHAFFVEDSAIEGEIPKELHGTLLRNGPALYEIGGKKIPQPFDGDGMLATFCFPGEGRAPFFTNRFVRTQAFVEEQQAGKMLYRGAFSVGNPSGGWLFNPFKIDIKKIANTGVVRWAGRLMALYERDLPYEVSTPDLRTIGRTDCDGAIDGPFFAAHYRIFTEKDGSRRLVGFNSAEANLDNAVTVWEFDEAGKQLHRTTATFPDAAFAFLHDFAMTEKHYIFIENPIRMNFNKLVTRYMFGKACIAECLQYDPSRPTKIHVLPRPGRGVPVGGPASAPRAYTTPAPFFSFHHANAWEDAEGRIVIDTVALPKGMDFSANLDIGASYYDDDVGRGMLTRVTVEPWSGAVTQYELMQRACEFPCVAPSTVGKPSTHTYLVGARFDETSKWGAPQIVVKATVDPTAGVGGRPAEPAVQHVFNPGQGRWCGEPIYVPKPGGTAEDDGWVLVLVFDALDKKSELAILDARDMKPVAKVKLPLMLPAGLHGSWTGEYLGPAADAPFAPTMYDIRTGGPLRYE